MLLFRTGVIGKKWGGCAGSVIGHMAIRVSGGANKWKVVFQTNVSFCCEWGSGAVGHQIDWIC